MAVTRKVGNMPSKLWISAQTGSFVLFLIVILSGTGINGQVSPNGSEDVPSTTVSSVLMNDILFRNLSESFSTQELEDAMISLNRTKRQSLGLLQLAQLAQLSANSNNNANAAATLPIQLNTSNNNGAPKQSSEGLLAQCQLTNLLLYQLMQQRQQAAVTNPFLPLGNANLQGLGSNLNLNIAAAAGTTGSLINPFPAAINQNLIFPAQTLQTYTTTTTFVTKLTTTAVLTIPLLFGNKPVPTTITRTKTYDVTTSEVQTVTSTVRPTYVTQAIDPTPSLQNPLATSSLTLNDVDEDTHSLLPETVSSKKFGGSKPALLEYEDDEPITSNSRLPNTGGSNSRLQSKFAKAPSRTSESSLKRRKPSRSGQSPKSSPFTPSSNTRGSSRDRDYQDQTSSRYGSTAKDKDDYYETDYQPYTSQTSAGKKGTSAPASNSRTSSGSSFSKRKYGNIYEDDVAVDDDPAAAQYPDDYSYYTRRLKRGEQYGDEGEYLLEPSTDGDFSNNYQKYERCPPIPKAADAQTVTVTRTETKTVTKFLGQSTLASNINLNPASRASYETPTQSSRKRSRSRSRSASSPIDQPAAEAPPAPTPESRSLSRSATEDTRAQILIRSRSRYNSNNSNNNNNYQQPNYDYYRG